MKRFITKLRNIVRKSEVFKATILAALIFVTCTKPEDPTPDTVKNPITKSVPNTITETQKSVTTITGDVGENKSMARYKGTATKGEVVSTFEVNGDVFTVSENPNYPKDSLVISFVKKGSEELIEKLKSTQQVEKTDINGDGVIDTITYTATVKEAKTTVNVDIKTEELLNTIKTDSGTIEEEITREEGETVLVTRLTGSAEEGEVISSYAIIEGDPNLVDITEVEVDGKKMLEVIFKGAGTVKLEQKLVSEDKKIEIDSDGDGIIDSIKNFITQTVSAITTLEGTPVAFGFNEQGLEELKNKLHENLIAGQSEIDVNFEDLVKGIDVTSSDFYGNVIDVFPPGALKYEQINNDQGKYIGVKLIFDYNYRGSDMQVTINLKKNSTAEELKEVINIEKGVFPDMSDINPFEEYLKGYFSDHVEKWKTQNPIIRLEMASSFPESKISEVKEEIFSSMDKLNDIFEIGNITKENGELFQLENSETTSKEANVTIAFGTIAEFEAKYPYNIHIDPKTGTLPQGVPFNQYKDGQRITREIVGSVIFVDKGADTVTNIIHAALQEMGGMLGMGLVEYNSDRTAVNSENSHVKEFNYFEMYSMLMFYNSKVELGMSKEEALAATRTLSPQVFELIKNEVIARQAN